MWTTNHRPGPVVGALLRDGGRLLEQRVLVEDLDDSSATLGHLLDGLFDQLLEQLLGHGALDGDLDQLGLERLDLGALETGLVISSSSSSATAPSTAASASSSTISASSSRRFFVYVFEHSFLGLFGGVVGGGRIVGHGRAHASNSFRTNWLNTQSTPKMNVGHDDEGHQHDDRVVHRLRAGRPRHLAQLAAHLVHALAAEQARLLDLRLGLAGRRAALLADRLAVRVDLALTLEHALLFSVHGHDGTFGLHDLEQGRRDSNPQPTVLETVALPVELLP